MKEAIQKKILKFREIFIDRYNMNYHRVLEKEVVGSCKTLLDLGCGSSSPIQVFSQKLKYTVGVDYFAPSIEKSKKRGIHHEYKTMNVLDVGKVFKANSFDCVVALDLLEHLSKEDGLRLLSLMKKIAKKKAIVFTPNGFLPQEEYEGNRRQVHLSGWEVEEMQNLGFRVIGIQGWKPLSRMITRIQWEPIGLWKLRVIALGQIIVGRQPKRAFQLFCVKEM